MAWLLGEEGDQRRSGRSLTIALGFLRYAVNRKLANTADHEWIRVWDHYPMGSDTASIILRVIDSIAQPLDVVVETQTHRFRLAYCHSGQTWDGFRAHLYDDYVETDVHFGLSPEQIAQQEAQRTRTPQLLQPTRRGGPTLRASILAYVEEHPGETATQVARALQHNGDAVASTLLKEVREGTLERRAGQGPRGGFAYFPVTPIVGMSVWDRLRVNPFDGGKDAETEDP